MFKKNSGLTLIELLIVLGIISIIATISTLNLFDFKAGQDLDFSTKEVVATIRDAQTKSITQENLGASEVWGVRFTNPSVGVGFYEVWKGVSYPGILNSKKFLTPNTEFETPAKGSFLDITFQKITGVTNSSQTVKIRIINDITKFRIVTVSSNGSIDF